MGDATAVNGDQEAYWNSDLGRTWVLNDAILDALMRDLTARLLARLDPRPGERAVDIGCGTGTTTLAIAERVGPAGHVLGVDISEPMLARARERGARLSNVSFVHADAQNHPFDPAAADLAVSRFGVMFFEDPVAAFRNIAAALKPGGRIRFVAWGAAAENPWFTIPRDAAIARVGPPAPQPPTAPGPLAFADSDHTNRLLGDAGFADIRAEPESIDLHWPGDFERLVGLATNLGPAARILRERGGGPSDEAGIRAAVAEGLGRFRGPAGVRVPAAFNFFTAHKP